MSDEPLLCQECGQPNEGGHAIYECDQCGTDVCSDCSENGGDGSQVFCQACVDRGSP